MNVLFFSVSIGAGHDSAARALEQEFLRNDPGCRTKIIDTFDYINPTLHKVVLGSYMESLRFNPKVWGYLYRQGEKGDRMVDLGQLLNKLLSLKLQQLMDEFQPDAIICTHAFPAGMVSVLKEKTKSKIPVFVVLTDFTIHPFWIHPHTDYYVIPSDQLIFNSIAKGMPADKIKPFGIPIRGEFAVPLPGTSLKEELGMDSRPVILVMGGGLGLGAVLETVRTLLATRSEIQIMAVAGKNLRLYEKLKNLGRTEDRLRVFGFINNVSDLMAVSEMIVTKPGGLTTAEVLARGLPMVIVDPLPGQEDRNTEFLMNWGVAVKARRPESLPPLINQLLSNKLRMKGMREMAMSLAKPEASQNICQFILDHLS